MTQLTREQVLSIYWTVFKTKTLQICALIGGFAAIGSAFTFCLMGVVAIWSLFSMPSSALLAQCSALGPSWALQTLGGSGYYLIMCSKEYGVARILCVTAGALLSEFLMLGYLAHLAQIA